MDPHSGLSLRGDATNALPLLEPGTWNQSRPLLDPGLGLGLNLIVGHFLSILAAPQVKLVLDLKYHGNSIH